MEEGDEVFLRNCWATEGGKAWMNETWWRNDETIEQQCAAGRTSSASACVWRAQRRKCEIMGQRKVERLKTESRFLRLTERSFGCCSPSCWDRLHMIMSSFRLSRIEVFTEAASLPNTNISRQNLPPCTQPSTSCNASYSPKRAKMKCTQVISY